MHVKANGIQIHYGIDGQAGAPWVTFVTGIANDVTMWDGQVPALERDFRILRFDSRGHGGTEATEGDYSFNTLIGDLLGLWDALGIRQSHLVGLGLGGSTVIGVGIDHSDRLLSLVPCACRADMTPEFAAVRPGYVETVKANGMEGMVEQTVQRWFKAANPEVLDSVRRQIRGTDPLGYFVTLSFEDRIDRISVPTLFITGADDPRGGPPAIVQRLADKVPGARHVSIPNAAHICNIQNPDAFNETLGGFLRAQLA
jgi:3-oxoadipate enol-lactonase